MRQNYNGIVLKIISISHCVREILVYEGLEPRFEEFFSKNRNKTKITTPNMLCYFMASDNRKKI